MAYAFLGFFLLTVWQAVVFFTDSYPDHIMPLVILLSGTEQSVPVAYSWTAYLGFITVVGLIGSAVGWMVCRVLAGFPSAAK